MNTSLPASRAEAFCTPAARAFRRYIYVRRLSAPPMPYFQYFTRLCWVVSLAAAVLPLRGIRAQTTRPGSIPPIVISPRPPRDPTAARTVSPGDFLAAQRQVLVRLADTIKEHAGVTVCVDFHHVTRAKAARARILAELTTPQRKAVPLSRCSRTYASLVLLVDSLGHPRTSAPPGWIDPYTLVIDSTVAWTPRLLVIRADLEHATWIQHYECEATHVDSEWHVTCESHSMTVF